MLNANEGLQRKDLHIVDPVMYVWPHVRVPSATALLFVLPRSIALRAPLHVRRVSFDVLRRDVLASTASLSLFR